jgi:hypothetical protein
MPLHKEFLVERQGRQFALYAGLLDLAHQEGLRAVTTELVQAPTDANGQTAVCRATVVTEKGTFTGLGDACPASVSRQMLPHLLRLAETRAKARALRDAVNVGVAAVEELGDSAPADPAVGAAESGGRTAARACVAGDGGRARPGLGGGGHRAAVPPPARAGGAHGWA